MVFVVILLIVVTVVVNFAAKNVFSYAHPLYDRHCFANRRQM